jgi:IS30 family transposase
LRQIGRALGRSAATVSRELRRNAKPTKQWRGSYEGERAHGLALRRRRWDARHKLARQPDLQKWVRDSLAMGQSPEQIAGRLEHEHGRMLISHESIYRFIYHRSALKDYWHRLLPRKKSRRGRLGQRGGSSASRISRRRPICERPDEADNRAIPGHWEADLMALVGLAFRLSSRLTVADNGTEFALHYKLSCKLSLGTFFCEPHAPWQKGGIENAIGRMRKFLPRKSDLATITQDQLDDLVARYNDTPRKCLAFKTPNEVFSSFLNPVALQT